MRNLRWVPSAPAPEFVAGGGIVAREAITADHDELFSAIIFIRHRRGKSFARFGHGFAGTEFAPEFFARRGIKREQIGLIRPVLSSAAIDGHITLEHLNVELS